MAPSLSMSSVLAILLLYPDSNASNSPRLFAKYYSEPHHLPGSGPSQPAYPTLASQKAFEKGLLEKTAKQTSDVILYDNKVVVFKTESDVMMYVVGEASENEVLLYNVVLCLRDALSILLKYVSLPLHVHMSGPPPNQTSSYANLPWLTRSLSLRRNSTDKRTLLENYDLLSLTIDEIVDDGIILETDPVMVASRVSKAPAQDAPNMKNIDLSEQGIQNLWEFGKKQGIEFVRRN
ncbi:putative coatomer subunit zeta, partial [Cyphellophora attinorum]